MDANPDEDNGVEGVVVEKEKPEGPSAVGVGVGVAVPGGRNAEPALIAAFMPVSPYTRSAHFPYKPQSLAR